jgi:hypothetical protein
VEHLSAYPEMIVNFGHDKEIYSSDVSIAEYKLEWKDRL